jgi:hypothetical protein
LTLLDGNLAAGEFLPFIRSEIARAELCGFVVVAAAQNVSCAEVRANQLAADALTEVTSPGSDLAAGRWLRFTHNNVDVREQTVALRGFVAATAAPNASCSGSLYAEAKQPAADAFNENKS